MSNRWVFLAAFLTATFIVAGAFNLSQWFFFELVKSSIFIAIGVMVFSGENQYSYMLGAVFPPLWFLVDILAGSLVNDFQVLFAYLGGKQVGPASTPLDGFARLAAIFLCIASVVAWRKEVEGPFWGKAFWSCLIISLAYVAGLAFWRSQLFPATH
ncbi:MAG TPA: hypothetical protein VMW54_05725 [Terriglobia bacterium]|nr:hypothetical protein [Terriglobia bacterium]